MGSYSPRSGESMEAYARRLRETLEARDRESQSTDASCTPDDNSSDYIAPANCQLVEVESMLAAQSQAKQPPGVQQLLESLQEAAVYTDAPNHKTNRKLWDAYARSWSAKTDWVQRMASHLPGDAHEVHCLGDEWSDASSLAAVLEDWVYPHVSSASRCAEIGSGGGRIARCVAPRSSELVCLDVSTEMLKTAQQLLTAEGCSNVRFQHISGDEPYPAGLHSSFDFVYSFDVFVHMDLHQMHRTLKCMHSLLKSGGQIFVSLANLLAPDGWRRFSKQTQYTVGGFYFVSPDIAKCLLRKCGFEIIQMSRPQGNNVYLNRDLLVLARKSEC